MIYITYSIPPYATCLYSLPVVGSVLSRCRAWGNVSFVLHRTPCHL